MKQSILVGLFGLACWLSGRDRSRYLQETEQRGNAFDRWLTP
jgi:hypothetical protein